MAYASWLNPSKTSGNGNDTINVSAKTQNTGRNARSTQITFKAVNCSDVTRTVNQNGKPEFVSFTEDTASSENTGKVITLEGTSNSSKLTFSKSLDNIGLTLPSTYTAAGLQTNNGANISGDPGAVQEYNWSIKLTIPSNTDTNNKTCQISVQDDGGHTSICTITLAAGEATLEVSPNTINLPWDASTSAQFTVTSNTEWTIE